AGPHGLVITPDGRYVYVSSEGDSKVSVIDTDTDTVTATIEVGTAPHGMAITADGAQVLVAVSGADTLAIIDTATNEVVANVAAPKPHNVAITPDGKLAYVAAQKEGEMGLEIVNLADDTVQNTIPLEHPPRALNFSPDGKWLYFTLGDVDSVQVLDVANS